MKRMVPLLLTLLAGCAAPHQVAFNESDFVASGRHGTGVVTGRAFALLQDGSTMPANREFVEMVPVNAYTTEMIDRAIRGGVVLRKSDPRFLKYRRSVTADAQGNFTFRGIPSGDYYVVSSAAWDTREYQDVLIDADNNTYSNQLMATDHEKTFYTRVTVHDGQTVRVTKWRHDTPTHNSFFSYSV